MKILALAVLLAVVQTGPPVPRKATDNPTHASSNVKDDSQSDKAPTHDSVTAVKTPANGPTESNGDQQSGKDGEHTVGISKLPPVSVTKDWADWGVWAFSGLLVIVGFLQIWLLRGTLRSLQHQTALMERQINKERARIRVELKPFKLVNASEAAAQLIHYTVTFYGSAYAFIGEETFQVELADSANEVITPYRIPSDDLPTVIAPGAPPDERLETLEMTQFEIDSIIHGKSFIHFCGRIKYRDFSEIDRETTISCVWKSWGARRKRSISGGGGRWEKIGPPEANHET
jgi:hypothetical protein